MAAAFSYSTSAPHSPQHGKNGRQHRKVKSTQPPKHRKKGSSIHKLSALRNKEVRIYLTGGKTSG
jgi:hypothetical protein